MELLKLLSANEIVAQVISFLILLILLRVFVWKRILGLLDKRKERIILEFKKIEEANKQIEELKAEYNLKISDIDQLAKQKIQDSLMQAKLILEEARKSGHLAAQEILDGAKANIKFELAKAKDELKNEIIDLTIKATENIIQEKLTEDGDRKLINDFLEGVDKLE
ncbi:MAG: F0F1 ATP synthase subunit B [Candidatus Omnitrophica bacterium]|nr:F0F1 ATP synthase subunit B [Candidatus Omnitrophota bacterium]